MRSLTGTHILVVEDEYFIAQDLRSALQLAGADVVGPVADAAGALQLLERGPVDAAVLDINLRGGVNFTVARELLSRNIPFLFATGYEPPLVPEEFAHIPLWRKPFNVSDLVASLHLDTRLSPEAS